MIKQKIGQIIIVISHLLIHVAWKLYSIGTTLGDFEIETPELDYPEFEEGAVYFNSDVGDTFVVDSIKEDDVWVTYTYAGHPIAFDRELYRWKLNEGKIEKYE